MHLSLINYQSNVNQNRSVAFQASPGATKKVLNLATTDIAKDATKHMKETTTSVAVGAGTVLTSLGVLKYKYSDISPLVHSERASEAMQKLKDSGFSNPDSELFHYQFVDLSYLTGNCFESIIDDFIKINKGVEEGQPVGEYVNLKLQEIMTKYDLPKKAKDRMDYTENVMHQLRYVFMNAWKNEADYNIATGMKKSQISAHVFRKQCKPDKKVLERFDDLLTRVGEPLETKKHGNITEYVYLNKYGDKIVVSDDRHFIATETLYINEPEGITHTITKEYYLGNNKFIDIAHQTNGAFCGNREEGASGITEYTKIGDDTETIKYDDWGIKETQINTEKRDNKEIEITTIYAGDGSIANVISKEEYLS